MELPELNFGGLRARLPIVQGGMGIGVSLSGLAAAVAREGGIGVISGVQVGFRDPDFARDPAGANLRAIGREVSQALRAAPGGVIGVNLMTAAGQFGDLVRQAARSGAHLIFAGAGLPLSLPELVQGTAARIVPIVSSLRACRLVVEYWLKKYCRLPDGVVVEGPLAGGHLGFSLQALQEGAVQSLEAIVGEVLPYLRSLEAAHGVKIPLIAGGGLNSHEDIARMLRLGAAGAQLGSVFVATEECDASPAFKAAYLRAREEDVRIIRSPAGLPARALDSAFLRRAYDEGGIPVERCTRCLPHSCDPAATPFCLSGALMDSATGQREGLVFCGARVGEIREMTTVPALMRRLAGQEA